MFNSPRSPTLPALNALFYTPSLSTELLSYAFASAQNDALDYQSSLSLKLPRAQTTRLAPLAGLGIICPTDQVELLGDSDQFIYAHNLSYQYDSPYGQHILGNFACEPIQTAPPEEPIIEPLRLSSVLNSAEFYQEGQTVPCETGNAAVEVPSFPVSSPSSVQEGDIWDLQKVLEMTGHTMDTLLPERSTATTVPKENAPVDENINIQLEDSPFVPLYFAQPFNPTQARSPLAAVNPADIVTSQSAIEASLPSRPQETLVKASLSRHGSSDKTSSAREALGTENSLLHEASDTTPSSLHVTPDKAPSSLHETANKVLADAEDSIVSIKKEEDLYSGLPVPLTEQNLRQLEEMRQGYKEEESEYEPSFLSSTSTQDYIPSPRHLKHKARMQPSRVTKKSKINRESVEPDALQPDINDLSQHALSDLSINYGTPVLDAHRGIWLDDLKAKAARYRMRNPGKEYDKKWLLSFAGKLTPQGQLMDEYRCYVVGCDQLNKRRDHIVIHVGGHLDQRPFACGSCGARFLRKNECKRHEFSHTGIRPFKCDLCPSGSTAFVRQDLLKRHQQRTHRMGTHYTSKRLNPKKRG